jgi:hypothetical protein
MRHHLPIAASIFLAVTAIAQTPKAYQAGTISQMESVQCGTQQSDANGMKAHESRCQEYTLQTDRVVYRVRSRNPKRTVLLPVGERVQFRAEKNKFLLRAEGVDSKEREYTVIAVMPLSETTGDARPIHLNHLQ